MSHRRTFVLVLAAGMTAVGMSARADDGEVTQAKIKEATSQAAAYLYSIANAKGVWDNEPAPPAVKGGREVGDADSLFGGRTSLALAALALAGEEKDPKFQKALTWLMAQKTCGTYATGLRLLLLRNMARGADYSAVLKRDMAYLQYGARTKGAALIWSYMPPPALPAYDVMGDYSNVNYAVLGLWAASDLGVEVPSRLWVGLERLWTQGQLANGAWAYFPAKDFTPKTDPIYAAPRGSMTAAGVASLYIIADQCYAAGGKMGAYRNSDAYKAIQAGLKWLADNFDARSNPGRPQFASYYFYNCERVGAAAGMKYFGEHDWFREIGQTILTVQRPDGSIPTGEPENMGGAMVDTAFSIMFLARAAAPVVMNKLQHGGDWDNHPRDLAAVTEWYARQSERPATWQVVNLKAPAEELTDSRILYIAGTTALSFTDDERAKLKRYVNLGGLLVFHPDSNDATFRDSVRKLLGQMWPNLEMTRIDPAVHPLNTFYMPLKDANGVRQLASPTRVYAFLLEGQPAEAWQTRSFIQREDAFNLAANLHRFATNMESADKLPTKLTFFAQPFRGPVPPTERTITLARVRWGPSEELWNPEPLALERFSRRLAAEKKIACEIKTVAPGELAGSGAKIALLTGAGAVQFSKEESNALVTFMKAGGTLVVDQAGGPPHARGQKEPFDTAFRALVEGWFGKDAMRPVQKDDPLFADMEEVSYRNVLGERRRKMPLALEHVVQNGRSVLFYSRYDITCSLLDCPNPLISGPSPDKCFEILDRILEPPTGPAAPKTPSP